MRIMEIGKLIGEQLIRKAEFKPSGEGDYHSGTQENLLAAEAAEVIKKGDPDKVRFFAAGVFDQIQEKLKEKDAEIERLKLRCYEMSVRDFEEGIWLIKGNGMTRIRSCEEDDAMEAFIHRHTP